MKKETSNCILIIKHCHFLFHIILQSEDIGLYLKSCLIVRNDQTFI